MLMQDLDRRHARRQKLHAVIRDALDFGPETFAVGDDEPEIADLRQVDPRVIDLIDDAKTSVNHSRELPSAQPTMSLALLAQVGGIPGPPGACSIIADRLRTARPLGKPRS